MEKRLEEEKKAEQEKLIQEKRNLLQVSLLRYFRFFGYSCIIFNGYFYITQAAKVDVKF